MYINDLFMLAFSLRLPCHAMFFHWSFNSGLLFHFGPNQQVFRLLEIDFLKVVLNCFFVC